MVPRIVIVAPYLTTPTADNAGLGYLNALVLTLRSATVTFIVPDTPANRIASASEGAPTHLLVPVAAPRPHPGLRSLLAMIDRMTPVRPPRGFVAGIRNDPRAVQILRDADIVDTQWPECGAILPLLARLAPNGRRIATLHDVPSQRYRRELRRARSVPRAARLISSVLHSRVVERRVSRIADTVVVFSEKDRALLPTTARSQVVNPPIIHPAFPTGTDADRLHPTSPYALFVGPLRRPENRDGLEWFAHAVWPRVRGAAPDARLLIAGSRRSPPEWSVEEAPGFEMLGFVENLDDVYRGASVVIAPLRLGAGVKFKVLEALSRAIPVVTTTVGAEGIGDSGFALDPKDDPRDFADAVVRAMTDTTIPKQHAARAQSWMAARYGLAQFEMRVRGIYGLAAASETPAGGRKDGIGDPEVSVVIPVRNGEHGIANALAALARQDEAPHIEIVVSDNGSTDRTIAVAQAFRPAFADLRVVDSSDRTGVSHARNVGIEVARAEKVLICDHDDEVRDGWVATLSAGLDRADVVGGRAISHRISGPARALESDEDDSDPLRTVFGYLPYVLGGCMGVRRSAAIAIGGFDEAFLRGHEEVDFCWRMQLAGNTIDGAPEAIVDYRQRDRAVDAARQRYHSARTRILLWTRHENTGMLGAVSFRGSIRNAIRSLRDAPLLLDASKRFPVARSIGGAFGTVDGHLRYRILGDPPPVLTNSAPMKGRG